MKETYPQLGERAAAVAHHTFGRPTDPGRALPPLPEDNGKGEHSLPWQAPVRLTLATIASTMLDNTMDALPIIGQLRANKQLKKSYEDPRLEGYERKQLAAIAANRNGGLYNQIFAVSAGTSTFLGYLF